MSINIYKDQRERGTLFGKPVLYTEKQVEREAVPEGWYCYDLCGTCWQLQPISHFLAKVY